MSATVETINLLRSIDASLRELLALSKSKKRAEVVAVSVLGVTSLASDRELDSERGNPIVKAKDPRDWTGPSMTGKHFSECPATYLDLLADRYDYFATKETDEQTKSWSRLDAARARGWAARVRAGYKPAAKESEGFPSDMVKADDISF